MTSRQTGGLGRQRSLSRAILTATLVLFVSTAITAVVLGAPPNERINSNVNLLAENAIDANPVSTVRSGPDPLTEPRSDRITPPTTGREKSLASSGSSLPGSLDGTVSGRTAVPTANCSLSEQYPEPDEQVSIFAYGSENADRFRYDRDGDGTYETGYTQSPTYETTYSDGTYQPRVLAFDESDETSDVAECPEVVVAANDPPSASLTYSPSDPQVGQQISFDATGSSDGDGEIWSYRWDVGADGSYEEEESRETGLDGQFTHTFTEPGTKRVRVTVEDDDGATDATERVVTVGEPFEAACTVRPREVTPGEEVTIDASGSTGGDDYQYDPTGEDGFGDFRDESTITVTYDEPGTYTPLVKVWTYPSEESQVVECPPVTVREENRPPNASLTHRPQEPTPGTTVTLDVSNSTDPDGRIVEYRWDVDGDGTTDRVTNGSTVTAVYNQTGSHPVSVVVVDDDGATDRTTDEVMVAAGGFPILECPLNCYWVGLIPIPPILWILWKLLPPIFAGGGVSGLRGYAAGTFETPTDGDVVTVTGLEFEPDLLLLSATSDVRTDGDPTPARTDAWTYGKVHRDGKNLRQNAVTVADDAQADGEGVATAREGRAIDLPIHGDDGISRLTGTVSDTNGDGFAVSFDRAELPAEARDDRYVVLFEAFDFADSDDVAVGGFTTPGSSGTQSVDLPVDPDHLVLTASNGTSEFGDGTRSDEMIGVSHGAVVEHDVGGESEDVITQRSVTSVVDPGSVHRNAYAATEHDAVHLLHGTGRIAGRTTGRATSVEKPLEMTYDETAGGDLVTYAAVKTGEGSEPELGHVTPPESDTDGNAPASQSGAKKGDGDIRRVSVDLGFEPGMVSLTACNVDDVEGERTVPESPLSFGWSHGVAVADGNGRVHTHALHSSLEPKRASGVTTLGTDATAGASESGDAEGAVGATDGGHHGGVADVGPSPPVATIARIDSAGRIVGREDVRVTRMTSTGFELAVTSVDSVRRTGGDDGASPVVFFTAWPIPGTRDVRTDRGGDR